VPKKLRVAEVCLRVVRSIWRYLIMLPLSGSSGTSVDDLKDIVEKEARLVRHIASFVFNYPKDVDSMDKRDTAALRSRGILLSFTSLALDLLTIETERARNSDSTSSGNCAGARSFSPRFNIETIHVHVWFPGVCGGSLRFCCLSPKYQTSQSSLLWHP
jgi:hypothetical protein